MKPEECFPIGTIMKARGLKGEIQLYFEGIGAENFSDLKQIFIEINKKLLPFFVEKIQVQKAVAYLYLEDINTIEQARELLKKKVYLPLSAKAKETDFIDPKSLKGYKAVDNTVGPLGTIREVMELPQHTVAACLYKGKEILFPINEQTILDMNPSNKTILLDLPEGLLDVYLD